jgi:hypothetical protein
VRKIILDEKDEEDSIVDGIMIYAEFQNYGTMQS